MTIFDWGKRMTNKAVGAAMGDPNNNQVRPGTDVMANTQQVNAQAAGIEVAGRDAQGNAITRPAGSGNGGYPAYQVQPQYYGGYEGGANEMSGLGLTNMNWAQGQAMQNREAQAVEDQVLSDREAQTRFGDQAGALQLHREAAMGMAPSEAAFLMQSGLDRSLANQQALAGSARGAAGIALAGQNAQANAASMQNQAFTQAGALRAAEMAQARGAYGDMSNQVRGQDQNRLGMGNQMSQFNAGLDDQYRLGMGQLGLGYYGASQRPLESQLGADVSTQGMQADSYNQAQSIKAGVDQAARDRSDRMADRWIQAYGTGLQIVGGLVGGPAGFTGATAAKQAMTRPTGTYNTGIGRNDPGYR